MPRLALPKGSDRLIEQLRSQLRSQSALYRVLQIVVGAVFPLLEAVMVNRATGSATGLAPEVWGILFCIAGVHILLLAILVRTEMPLSGFLVEFDEHSEKLSICEGEAQALVSFRDTLRNALVTSELSLIGLELSLDRGGADPEQVFEIILEPWVRNRAAIFWPQGGDAMYNMAVYLLNDRGELEPKFRRCDDRIQRHDRSWRPRCRPCRAVL